MMNKHLVISVDPRAEVHRVLQLVNAAWAKLTDEQRETGDKQHKQRLAELVKFEEKIRRQIASSATLRELAEAYNAASPAEQARPWGEWMADYRRREASAQEKPSDE